MDTCEVTVTVPPGQGEQPGASGSYGQFPGSQAHGQQPTPSQFPGQPSPGQPTGAAQPFGQQPQPFGQQSQQYGVAPPLTVAGHAARAVGPPEKKGRKRIAVIVSIMGALVLGDLAVVGCMTGLAPNPVTACTSRTSPTKRDPTVVDCSDEKATFSGVRLEDGGSCPDGDYDEIAYEEGARLCLMLNVKEGDCLANFYSPTKGYEKVSCTDPKADISIMKIVEGTDDAEQACASVPGVLGGLRSPEPATVICASEPTAA